MDNEALEHRVADLERRLKKLEAVMYLRVTYPPVTYPTFPVAPDPHFRVTIAVPDGPPSY